MGSEDLSYNLRAFFVSFLLKVFLLLKFPVKTVLSGVNESTNGFLDMFGDWNDDDADVHEPKNRKFNERP
jgi:hypothetical protein